MPVIVLKPANSGDYRFRPLLSILYFIIFLMIIFLSPFDAAAFKYSGAAGPAAPSNTAVKIIAPNAGTDMIFNGQGNPNTTFWKCSGGRVIVADFDSDGNNDIIVASPYGEYDFSNDFTGMITIYKGPVTQATQGGTFSWDSGSWNQAVNVANTGYILGSASREHTGYAIAAGHFGARALVIGRAFETGTPSQVAVIFSRAINNLNGTGTAIKANLIDMSQTGNPAGTLGKNDMKNFSLLITNIPGANAPNASLTHPNNFLPVNGISLACGDVNSDGIDDIIIGCPGDNGGIGAVYVIKGKNTGWKDNDSTTDPITIDVTSMTTADGYKITGVNAGDNFGASVLVSDIYGDAKNELVIGAPGAQSAQGGAIIIPGGTIDGWTLAEYNVAVGIPNAKAISGPGTAGMRFGHALTSGKFHDSAASKNDLIVSEFVDANNSTSAYIIFGNAAIPAANPIPVDVTIKPKNAAERFGFAVSCGDINGDSFDDIAVTAPCGVIDDTNNRGKVYVIHGANYSSGTVIDLSNADRPFYDSSFQAQGNLDRLNTGNNSYYYGWGAVIAEAGGPGASRKELIVTAYSEVPSTTTAFANSGLCGVAYIMYTSTRPNQPVTTEIASPTSASNITLNWNNFSDPDTGDTMKCYHVQFSTDPDFKDFSKIIDSGVVTVAGNTTSHNLVINNDGVYHYRVRVGDDYSFSQFSTSRQLMINKTPPTNVEDITMPGPAPINGQNLVGTGGPRTIKIRVTDNIMCANQITAEVWIKSTDDVNANDVWDAGEGSTMIATPITPVAAVTDYSFNINEGATKDNIRIYITGWNAAKNLIPEALGGTRGNPKIEYNIHSNQGPVVSGWKINVSNPANPALKKFPDSDAAVFVNDPRPVITANLADDDSTVTNIRLKVQGAEFTVGGSLGYVDPLMTFTASSDLSNGSLPVELVSAEDAYGNPLQNITTTAGFVIDRNGPDADAANCQPINGGGSDKDQPVIVFALKDIAGADPFKVPGCGIKSSIEVRIINGGVTTVYTLDNSGVYAENGVIKTPGAITIDDSGAATGSYFIRFDMKLTDRHLINGATQAVVKAYDKLDNPMAGGTYTINFMVGLTGPQAEKSEPQPDNVKVNNAKIQIRIWSEEYAIDTQSVDFRIVGPAPASNIIYQKIGCNQSELVYDPLTTLLTFDPSKTAPPTVYEQGTITVFLNDVKDSEGNQLRSRPLTWTFIFDSIGPVAGTDTVPIKDAWTKNNKQIVKMKVFDVTTKVVGPTIKFKVDGNTYTTSSLGMNYDPLSTWITFDPTTQSVTFADKQITVELSEAFDEAGNPLTTGANNTWSFKVDSTPPAAFNFEPPQDAVRNVVSFPVRCRLTDDYSGIDTNSISFKINNSQITTFTVAPDGTLSYNATLPLGVNTCEVSVKDIAGNDLAGSPVKWSFVIDNNRMYVINDADSPKPAGNTFTNIAQNSVSLKMSKTFSGLDTDSIIFVVKQGGEQGATIPGTATAEEKTDHYLLTWTSTGGNFQEGIIYAALTQCLNNAGWNYDGAIFSWSFTYDKTKPAVTLDAQSPSPAKDSIQTNNKVPITIKLDDALSGIDLASLTLSIAAGGSPPPGTSYNVSDTQLTYDAVNKLLKFNTVNIFPDGKLVVTLTSAKDRAGNTYDTLPAGSLPYSWSFNIDTTLPVCQITRPAADNDIVLTNDDYITATLGDPQGINTNEIKITIVSSVDNTLENMLPITPPYFTFTADNPTNGTLKYDPKLKSPPLKFSDAFIDVYIYAKDNAGFEIVPNPIHRIYLVDTTGPVIIDGSKPPIVDSRLPAPLSTVGVSAAQPIFVKCRLEDMPAGVKNDSITYKFTTTDAAGNVLSDTATPLTVNNISPTVIELIYTLPNSVITAGAIPDVCTCEMEILSATDKTSALHTLRSKSTNKWMFYINNSNPIAINPYPANNTIITSDSAETGITLFHAFGINTASIEFYYNNTQALFPSSPANYLFVYDETGARLSFKPHGTAVSRWIEGTNTVELRHAKEKIGGKDIVAPVIWSFLCDTVPPLASMNFPNTQYVTNQNIDILINLTDATSGIDPASVTFAIKKQGEADFSSFYLTAGSDLSYANNILKYSSGQPYQPGTHEIKLTRAKDKAGHNYTTPPYPPGGETPLTFTFCVAKDGPVASIIQPLPDSVVDYILKPGSDEIIIKIEPPPGSPGVDPSSIELEITEGTNAARIVKVIPGSGLTYNETTKLLSYRYDMVVPPLPIPEGTIKVKLKNALDYLGKSYISSPNPLIWSFIVDTIAPVLYEAGINPPQNKYALNDTDEITMRLDDGPVGSGFDTASIQIEVKYYPVNNPANQITNVVNVGTFLKFEKKPLAGVMGDYLLTYIPSPAYAEGTVDVRLISCKDRAGHQYISNPSGLFPYSYKFTVDLASPKITDDLVQPGHISALRYTNNNMLPIIINFNDGRGSQVNPDSIQLSVGGLVYKVGINPELTYTTDASSLTLTFTPVSAYPEGAIEVILNGCFDYAGRPARGFPSNISPPDYKFSFICDTIKPVASNPVPMNNSFTADNHGFISVQLKDTTSGVNDYSITVRDKNSNILALTPSATVYNPATSVLRTRTQNPMPEGTISVEVWCRDRATNEIESSETPPRYRWSFLVNTGGPTVNMIKPSPATHAKFPRLNDNLQKIDLVFNDNGVAIEQASITLVIRYSDATAHTFKLSQPDYLTYDALNKKLTFNPASNNPAAAPPIIYKEGTVSVSVTANNLSGFNLAGNTNWQFQIDSKGPYVVTGSPMPVPDSTTGNNVIPIKLKIKDDLGSIDVNEILLKITNANLPGGVIDNISTSTVGPGGLTPLSFNPADGEITFDPIKMGISFSGEVIATLKRAKDDLGNNLNGGQFSWKFSINSTAPWADNPRLNKVIGGVTGPSIPAAGAIINSMQFITTLELYPQQASAYIVKTTIKVKIGGSEYAYSEPAMIYTPITGQNYGVLSIDTSKLSPSPSIPSNDSLEISLIAVQNSLGTDLASPYKYGFIIDTLPPSAGATDPADKSIITNPRRLVSIDLIDPPAHRIDTSSIELTVNGVSFNSVTGGLSYNPVTHRVEFNPLSVHTPANYSFKKGNNNLTLINARDAAGNSLAAQKSWSFYVDDTGPVAFLNTATPAPNTIIGDPRSPIGIKVTSEGTKINPATFVVNLINHTVNFGDISGTDEVRGITYNESTGFYNIDPARHPLLTLNNGTVSVTLKKVENLAGNQLQNPVNWQYYLDRAGPAVMSNSRTMGLPEGIPPSLMTSNRTQKVFFDLIDENHISQIDVTSLKMLLIYGGSTIEVGAYSPGCDYSVSLGRFSYDPSKLQPPVQYPDGTVTVILEQAKDKWGNLLKPNLNNVFAFNVNTRGPQAFDPSPLPGEIISAVYPKISFKLKSEPPSSVVIGPAHPIEVRVNGILYSSKSLPTPITMTANKVTFDPSAIGLQFGSSQIIFEIVTAFDSLGNTLRPSSDPNIGPSNSWIFKNDVTPPAISAPSPAHHSVTGLIAPIISATIRDNFVSVVKDSIRIKINGGSEIGQPFISYDSSTGRMSCNLTQAGLTDRLSAGDNTIKITAVSDSLGNTITAPYSWNVYRDAQPPEVTAGSERPLNDSKGNILKPVISFSVIDNPKTVYGISYSGEIDRNSIKVRIMNGSTDRIVKYGDTGFYYTKPNVTIDTSLLGLNFVDGLCEVSVLGSAGGELNAMADTFGNKMAANYNFSFTVVSSGPYVYGVPSPAPGSAVTTNKPLIKINLRSDKSTIKTSSIKLIIDGVTYTTNSAAMSFAGEELRFNAAEAGLSLREGSIEVRLAEAEDELGNRLKADTSGINPWTFRVDTAGPTAKVGANLISDELPTTVMITARPSETLTGTPSLKAVYGDGSISYIDLSDSFGDQKYYSGVLELAAIPGPPVTFTFIGTDINGVYSEVPITDFNLSKTSVVSPVTIKPQKYYLIGFPLAPDNTSVTSAFGGLPSGSYTLWEGVDSKRAQASYIIPGRAYWLLNSSNSDINISANGYEMNSPMQKFDINLSAGWNLISFPYNSRVKFSQCTVKGAQGETAVFASDNAYIERAMWSYDYNTTGSPTFSLNHQEAHIMPFTGYYIYAYDSCVLRVPPVFVPNDEVNKNPLPPYGMYLSGSGAAAERNLWYRLSVSCDNYRDEYNYLGLKDGAKDTLDSEFDLIEPPVNPVGQGSYISAYLGEGTAVKYCSDFRSTTAIRKKWNFIVKTNLSGKTASISWQQLRDRLPYNYDLILYDRLNGGTVNMRTVSSYQFSVTSSTERLFTIIFNPINASGEITDPTDVTKPTIISKSPYENQQNVPITSAIYIKFDKKLNPDSIAGSVSLSNLSSGALIHGTFHYDQAVNEVSFKPDNNLDSNTMYKITINNISDMSGNIMQRAEWMFTSAKVAQGKKTVNITIKKGWNLFSVPLYPDTKNISEIFAGINSGFALYNRNGNKLDVYNGINNGSPFIIGPGKGYWFYSHSDSDLTLKITGSAVANDISGERFFEIPLVKGFNQSGTPYYISDSDSMSLAAFGFRLKNSTEQLSVTAAINAGYVRNTVYTFTKIGISGQINPVSFTDINAKIKRAEGFFVYSNRDDLILRIPAPAAIESPQKNAASSSATRKKSAETSKNMLKAWKVKIGVTGLSEKFSDSYSDPNNYFGCDFTANEGLDGFDVIKLISPPPYLALHFINERAGGKFNLASDIRQMPLETQNFNGTSNVKWRFELSSSALDYMNGFIFWEPKELPATGKFILTDKILNVDIDMRTRGKYSVVIDGAAREYEITYYPEMR